MEGVYPTFPFLSFLFHFLLMIFVYFSFSPTDNYKKENEEVAEMEFTSFGMISCINEGY
ncbi:hypothetical protein BDV25DRAFT_162359 [Aspergillus avenaceus]|uniref:Uncharacterized protein n=1 Tax=Aspergillus avenaceus TaxID=36643 RepID=A0A5N6TJJ9_ASPAV|nr:hypothetical protein BDV25DRAFT_162359 [Aspergillus avenaceus]